MALSASTVFEIRTAGADTNGGGFVTGATGTDYSLQNAKNTVGNNISTTDAVANGTTTITSAGASFTSAITGNIIYLQGGTGSLAAGWYQATFVSATSITVDRTVATGTGITMNIGGALASLGMAGASASVNGMTIYMKAGSYSITSASNNVTGGCFSRPSTGINIIGYNSTRGDMSSTRAILTASGAISSFTVINVGNSNSIIACLEVDCASKSTAIAFNIGGGKIYKCKASNATSGGFITTALSTALYCEATGCATASAAFSGWQWAWGCVAHDNTVPGFAGNGQYYYNCIADTNTGATSDGFTSGSAVLCVNCIAYNNGRDGFRITTAGSAAVNCIAESNTGIGFNLSTTIGALMVNCATFGNGTATTITGVPSFNLNPVAGASSFFTNAASADFSLNNTASAGAALRAASALGVFPAGTTTGYLDIGAAQHQDPAGGGGAHSAVF